MLTVITDKARVEAAAAALERSLRAGTARRSCHIGYRGGGGTYDIHWNPVEQFWSVLSTIGNRYWNCFGLHPSHDGPRDGEHLAIVCEVNPPLDGANRRCAGAFVMDECGRVLLAHNGRVGGGRKGIGKVAFLESLDRPVLDLTTWPDGLRAEMLVLGAVDDPALPRAIGQFVRSVQSFKARATLGA